MKLRFSEHIIETHREGILDEIELMGGTIEQLDEDSFSIEVSKPAETSSVLKFLQQEQRIGNLDFDE